MTTKHTPGPWAVVKYDMGDKRDLEGVFAPGDLQPVMIAPCAYGTSLDESDANARLIAAAPDLLEIVRDVREAWGAEFDRDEPVSGADVVEWLGGLQLRLKVVLAKAEGAT